MNIVDVFVGKDAYDYNRFPSHYVQETNVDAERIDDILSNITSTFKAQKIPWYLMIVTTFEVGGEITTVHYHNAHPMKEKIILNKQAKMETNRISDKLEELLNGHHGLAVNVGIPAHMTVADAIVNAPAIPEPQHWMWADEPFPADNPPQVAEQPHD